MTEAHSVDSGANGGHALALHGVTHRVDVTPVEDDRWDYMLTVTSPAGTGQALLTPDECFRLREFLLNGRDPGPGTYVDDRCRCTGVAHERYGDDCFRVEAVD